LTDISENIAALKKKVPDYVKLVAVSKTMSAENIMLAYDSGQRIFGENRVQELLSKKNRLPPDIEWHFIGHLQTKKVKQIVNNVALIQSVDSYRLLSVIDREASKSGVDVDCLLQFHIAKEETKSGFLLDEAVTMLESEDFHDLENVRICGVMGMATFTDNSDTIHNEFRNLKNIFDGLKEKYFAGCSSFSEISMGMTGDYNIAIEEGSTMIRIGSGIFGERNYQNIK
jgi:pyridoxal phosphate enzyme (YggS family)